MVAYALSCCRFKGRRLLQNLSVIVNLFPGVLAMIAVYFVLKYLNLTTPTPVLSWSMPVRLDLAT